MVLSNGFPGFVNLITILIQYFKCLSYLGSPLHVLKVSVVAVNRYRHA